STGAAEGTNGKKKGVTPGRKYKSSAKTKRATEGQLTKQLQLVKEVKGKLKNIVDKFEVMYPEGVNFTPGAKDLDLV
ncbi:unnamed protein product, partial [Sphacelaria rigidula]